MRENIENLIRDCKKIVEAKAGCDDDYNRSQVNTTRAIIMRLEAILLIHD